MKKSTEKGKVLKDNKSILKVLTNNFPIIGSKSVRGSVRTKFTTTFKCSRDIQNFVNSFKGIVRFALYGRGFLCSFIAEYNGLAVR